MSDNQFHDCKSQQERRNIATNGENHSGEGENHNPKLKGWIDIARGLVGAGISLGDAVNRALDFVNIASQVNNTPNSGGIFELSED